MPTSGDRLFRKSAHKRQPDLEGSWLALSASYKRAADDLVSMRAPADPDIEVYPIVYLYRHFLELELKSVAALDCVLSAVREDNAEQDDDDSPH